MVNPLLWVEVIRDLQVQPVLRVEALERLGQRPVPIRLVRVLDLEPLRKVASKDLVRFLLPLLLRLALLDLPRRLERLDVEEVVRNVEDLTTTLDES